MVATAFTSPQQGSFRLDLSASGIVATSFTKVLGQQSIAINATSEVLWGVKKLELALALDNTGSMSSNNKMTELKKAAHGLLDTLKKAAKKDGDIKIAIIPFDTTVNLGTSYKNEPWFDFDSIDCNGGQSGNGCNSSNWKDHWEGCIRDRAYPYDAQDTAPTSANTNTLFPVHDCGELAKLLPLTTDWTKLKNKVDEMQPNGNTNVTIGLAWGWHALTKSTPLSEAADPSPDLDKVLLILTDGDNTESWDNTNNKKVTTESAINARTALACTNIKAANVKIYAVRVINGNSALLKPVPATPACISMCSRRASSTPCSARSPRTSPICASPSDLGQVTSGRSDPIGGVGAAATDPGPDGRVFAFNTFASPLP